MKSYIYNFLVILCVSFSAISYASRQAQHIPGNQQGQKTQPGQITNSNQHSDVLEVQYSEEGITASEGGTVDIIVVVEGSNEEVEEVSEEEK